MKTRLLFPLVLLICLFPFAGIAQLNNGGLYSGFGVDADTRSNYMKYGIATGDITSDDWFSPSLQGNGVIDTSNASYYLSLLQSGSNYSFSKRMSQLLYAKVSGKLWLDAAYGKDYMAAASLKDSTTFGSAAKNGENPTLWSGAVASTPGKNDLVDVFAHMRRDGINVRDSLWLFTGASIYSTNGNSYFDVELYKNSFTYNAASGIFSSSGTSQGHTEWLFDAGGNIIQTGDLIIATTSTPGTVPVIDVRIWISQTTFSTYYGGAQSPTHFNFNGNYSSSAGSTYGYASIVSKTGITAFGGGISNYSATPAQDTTYATPWGTTASGSGWSAYYQSQQFIEVGLNLTRIGVDPAMYPALNPCQSLFSNIFFKSRSSSSFTANLQDFVAPLTFLRSPVMDFSLKTDTLRCNHPTGTIVLTNNTTAGYYTWQAMNGGTISGTNADSSLITVRSGGSYIVSASPAQGCPTALVDTIVVPVDSFPPVASAFSGLSGRNLNLYGGNTSASNYPTPFGGSHGLLWNWSGPGGFTSTVQNPVTDTVWGTYNLMVTEERNGCTALASTAVNAAMFTPLEATGLQLHGKYVGQEVYLQWETLDQSPDISYIVERTNGDSVFRALGLVPGGVSSAGTGPGSFSFTDAHPEEGNNLYRIKAVTAQGNAYYSSVITIGVTSSRLKNVYLSGNDPADMSLVVNSAGFCKGLLAIYTVTGQVLQKREMAFSQGMTRIPLSNGNGKGGRVVVLFIDGRVAWAQKILF